MTDRAQAFVVMLDDDYRLGDGDVGADRIMDAIRMIRGVVDVRPLVSDMDDILARERVKFELRQELRDVLWGKP